MLDGWQLAVGSRTGHITAPAESLDAIDGHGMRIGFVGLGRVATAFARGFAQAGLEISPSFDKQPEKACAWRQLGFPVAETIDQAVSSAEVLFITTTDDAIEGVASRVSQIPGAGKLSAVFHTSGATSANVLSCLKSREVDFASIHPVMSFSGEIDDTDRLHGCQFCVEAGTEAGVEIAAELCERLGGEVVKLSGEAKVAHHLACVFASNFAILLMDKGRRVHEKAGVGREASLAMLGRLVKAAVENTRRHGPEAALTGPFSRGDVETVTSHVRWLTENMPELLEVYVTLGRKTVELSLRAGRITQQQAAALHQALSEPA